MLSDQSKMIFLLYKMLITFTYSNIIFQTRIPLNKKTSQQESDPTRNPSPYKSLALKHTSHPSPPSKSPPKNQLGNMRKYGKTPEYPVKAVDITGKKQEFLGKAFDIVVKKREFPGKHWISKWKPLATWRMI